MNKVALVKCADYNSVTVEKAAREAVSLCGLPDISGKSVLLKPNILSGAEPEAAITTHPEVLRAAIRIFRDAGASRITVGDSPAVNPLPAAGKKAGLFQVTVDEGAVWGNFNRSVSIEGGRVVSRFDVVEETVTHDIIVSLPKFKTHQMMYYTGAMKNLFGLIHGLGKSRFHFRFPDKENFARMIVDLNRGAGAHFTLMDAVVGMEGPGPGNGSPRKAGFLLASPNILAADLTGAELMGYDPMQIPILRQALEDGFWMTHADDREILGETVENLRIPDWDRIEILSQTGFAERLLPEAWSQKFNDLVVPKPVFLTSKCILCEKCVKICPAKALERKKGRKGDYIHIDYQACIKCYCCHEVCPADAIVIRRRKPLRQGR